MAFFTIVKVPVSSDGSGNVATSLAAALSAIPNGNLRAVRYVHTANPVMTGTPGLVLSGATTGKTMLTATIAAAGTDQEWQPQELSAKSTDGTATTTYTDIPVAEDITIAMSACGANKKATLYFFIGD